MEREGRRGLGFYLRATARTSKQGSEGLYLTEKRGNVLNDAVR